jgi:CDP-diacylglycerol---glycerol-3-phosphate 3-phosphatidyltransferase
MAFFRPDWLVRAILAGIGPVTNALVRWRIHPNTLTTVGFLVTISAGAAFHFGQIPLGGGLVILGGIFDIFDGRVARQSGLASSFGSFYDSTLDRISEIVVFLGLLSLYNHGRSVQDVGMIYVVVLAMAGSLMVSYTRARAEALGINCTVGLMQRPERVVLIGLSALLFGSLWEGVVLKGVLILMALLTNFTAFQRIAWVYIHTRPHGEPRAPLPSRQPGQSSASETTS